MRAFVLRWLPEEACGLMAGHDGQVERLFLVPNELHSPVRFRMEPQAQLEALMAIDRDGMDLVAIFHSHPTGPPVPSETDVSEFAYPGAATMIWAPEGSGWSARAFLIDSGRFEEVAVSFVER